ncbi:6-hydroxymethylpterin diphosphokinase MptE-like protein [Metasolibacillus meyeri]|uniref:motility associated factor glycosyltransferase family protein n=1 Tax=Metasolibacillus meyeri TaxID=1071052 RepID=UPI000D31088C|nr:6-hydroxymethylpterin diphosphokinase MptE-like protein [Metasolibacillus meyeri]
MKWTTVMAKNGEHSLQLNDVSLYSRYRPREDAWRWIDAEFDDASTSYLLIGLGLGYHAERLVQLADGRKVLVYCFEQQEQELCQQYNINACNFEVVTDLKDRQLDEHIQVLIPNQILQAIGQNHPLFAYLEVIKINQVTYKKSAEMMQQNFRANIQGWSKRTHYPTYKKKIACLVASGPSLNTTVQWLKNIEEQVEIFVVGSALKMLLAYNIVPSATIISDAKKNILQQFTGVNYNGDLFYLSTANTATVSAHQGDRYLMLQQGYTPAEQLAHEYNMPMLETGGSVSTIALSLLDYLGFEKIILFGLDLGFEGDRTHAGQSTSGRTVQKDTNIRIVKANDGSKIQSTPNLQSYAKWIEAKGQRMTAHLYTTSAKGTYISQIECLIEQELLRIVQKD